VYEISYGKKPAYNYTDFNYTAVLSHQFNQYLNLKKCPSPTEIRDGPSQEKQFRRTWSRTDPAKD